MSTIPSHYKLVQEGPDHYEVHDERDGRNFHIAKKGLDLKMHGNLSKIQHFSKGGQASLMDDLAPDPLVTLAPEDIRPEIGEQFPQSQIPEMVAPQPKEQGIALPQVQDINGFQKNQIQKTSALEDEKAALQAGAQAEAQQGANTAASYGKFVDKINQQPTPTQIYEQNKEKNEKLLKAYQSKDIDPEHYWESKSTGSKITAALGMLIGGLGTRDGGPNYALKNIQQSIDRDIKAQMENRSAKMNLYKMNLEASQNEQKALLDTQNQMLLGVKAEALKYAAIASGPVAQARVAPAISALDAQISQNTLTRSLLSGASNGNKIQADPSLLVNTMIPKESRAAAFKEIEERKNLKDVKDSMLKAYNEINGMFGKGILSPSRRDSLIESLVGPLVKATEGTYTENQAKAFLNSFFPKFWEGNETSNGKSPLIDDFFRNRKTGSVFKQSGLDLDQFESTSLKNSPQNDYKEKAVNYIKTNAGNKDPKVQTRVNFLKQELGK